MASHDIEMILMRQLASCLAMPVMLVDPLGNLAFYNEHAEPILGVRYDETGSIPVKEWPQMFQPLDKEGKLMDRANLPLFIALREQRPAHRKFRLRGFDGIVREIEATALPLIGQSERMTGTVVVFWETVK